MEDESYWKTLWITQVLDELGLPKHQDLKIKLLQFPEMLYFSVTPIILEYIQVVMNLELYDPKLHFQYNPEIKKIEQIGTGLFDIETEKLRDILNTIFSIYPEKLLQCMVVCLKNVFHKVIELQFILHDMIPEETLALYHHFDDSKKSLIATQYQEDIYHFTKTQILTDFYTTHGYTAFQNKYPSSIKEIQATYTQQLSRGNDLRGKLNIKRLQRIQDVLRTDVFFLETPFHTSVQYHRIQGTTSLFQSIWNNPKRKKTESLVLFFQDAEHPILGDTPILSIYQESPRIWFLTKKIEEDSLDVKFYFINYDLNSKDFTEDLLESIESGETLTEETFRKWEYLIPYHSSVHQDLITRYENRFQEQLTKSTEQLTALRADIEEKKRRITELEEQISRIRTELETLRTTRSSEETSVRTTLEERLVEKNKELESLRTELSSKNTSYETLQGENKTLKESVKNQIALKEAADVMKESFKTESETYKKQLEEQTSSIEAQRKDLEAREEELRRKNDEYISLKSQLDEDTKSLRKSNESLEEQKQRLQEKIDEASQYSEEQRVNLEKIQSNEDAMRELQEKTDRRIQEATQEAERAKEEARTSLDSRTREIAKEKEIELTKIREEQTQLTQRLESLQTEKETIQSSLETLEETKRTQQERLDKQQEQLKKQTEELDSMKQSLVDKETEYQSKLTEIEREKESRIGEFEKRLQTIEEDKKRMSEELDARQIELQTLRESQSRALEERTRLESEQALALESIRRERESQTTLDSARIRETQEALDRIQSQLKEIESLNEKINEELRTKSEELRQKTQEVTERDTLIKEKNKEIDEAVEVSLTAFEKMKTQIDEEHTQELKKLKEEYEGYKQELEDEREEEKKELEKTKESIQTELKKYQERTEKDKEDFLQQLKQSKDEELKEERELAETIFSQIQEMDTWRINFIRQIQEASPRLKGEILTEYRDMPIENMKEITEVDYSPSSGSGSGSGVAYTEDDDGYKNFKNIISMIEALDTITFKDSIDENKEFLETIRKSQASLKEIIDMFREKHYLAKIVLDEDKFDFNKKKEEISKILKGLNEAVISRIKVIIESLKGLITDFETETPLKNQLLKYYIQTLNEIYGVLQKEFISIVNFIVKLYTIQSEDDLTIIDLEEEDADARAVREVKKEGLMTEYLKFNTEYDKLKSYIKNVREAYYTKSSQPQAFDLRRVSLISFDETKSLDMDLKNTININKRAIYKVYPKIEEMIHKIHQLYTLFTLSGNYDLEINSEHKKFIDTVDEYYTQKTRKYPSFFDGKQIEPPRKREATLYKSGSRKTHKQSNKKISKLTHKQNQSKKSKRRRTHRKSFQTSHR
jgi:hypothetical protein